MGKQHRLFQPANQCNNLAGTRKPPARGTTRMRKRQSTPDMRPLFNGVALLAALWLAGCSSSSQMALRSLLEAEKTSMRDNFAENIGATPQEVSRAFDSSVAVEMQAAAQITDTMVARHGISEDAEMQAYLQGMVEKLTKNIDTHGFRYKVVLLNDERINAFTPGGGTILVKEGLLSYCKSESQAAAVLAHEVAHIVMRHPNSLRRIEIAKKTGGSILNAVTPQGMKDNIGKVLRLGGRATMNGMVRAQESEADSVGIDIMVAAGYDPRGMVEIQQTLSRHVPQMSKLANAIHGNHPLSSEREIAAFKKIRESYPTFKGKRDSRSFARLVAKYHKRRPAQLANRL
jgi:predicted Zn-dependent protease